MRIERPVIEAEKLTMTERGLFGLQKNNARMKQCSRNARGYRDEVPLVSKYFHPFGARQLGQIYAPPATDVSHNFFRYRYGRHFWQQLSGMNKYLLTLPRL